jgi:hypothetical protein
VRFGENQLPPQSEETNADGFDLIHGIPAVKALRKETSALMG